MELEESPVCGLHRILLGSREFAAHSLCLMESYIQSIVDLGDWLV